MLQIVALAELMLCWLFWALAFVKPYKQRAEQPKVVATAPISKVGIGLVMASYFLVWLRLPPAGFQKGILPLLVSMILAPPAVALVWVASRHLGNQWRFQAAVNEDHTLVQTGPYRLVRHPIYLSMFVMLLATAACWAWWPMAAISVLLFLAGTEIRIRAEDRLLADRFHESFDEYRSHVRAYIPFLR